MKGSAVEDTLIANDHNGFQNVTDERHASPVKQGEFKPSSYPTVSIYIMVCGAQAVTDFAKNAFSAEEIFSLDRPDGLVRHAEIQIDDSVIMIAMKRLDLPHFPFGFTCTFRTSMPLTRAH